MSRFTQATVFVIACLACDHAAAVDVRTEQSYFYASELFGPGHQPIKYPADLAPAIRLAIPSGSENSGTAEIIITLDGKATFAGNVKGLTWLPNGTNTTIVTAPGTVASIVSGGRDGDNSITIRVEAAGSSSTADLPTTDAAAAITATRNTAVQQIIWIAAPSLANLEALAGAKHEEYKPLTFFAESRLVSGAFPNGPLTGEEGKGLVWATNSHTLSVSDSNAMRIGIDDDGDRRAFYFVKQTAEEIRAGKEGMIHLGTVTVETRPVLRAAAPARQAEDVYKIRNASGTDIGTVYRPAANRVWPFYIWYLLDLNGDYLYATNGIPGVLRVDAEATRSLFNEGDALFVDYDRDGKMGQGEGLAIDAHRAAGTPLSIDAAESDSFDEYGRGIFDVYYLPGGKEPLDHGAEIKVTASLDFSDPSTIDEEDVKSTTTFNFDGVESEVLAYAIPFVGNDDGDMANLRIRCENVTGCRVFVECTDDNATRSFGEAGQLAYEKVTKWDAERLEELIGVTSATSRHSCRILSKGKARVQQLTRDGSSNALVNNTYIAE